MENSALALTHHFILSRLEFMKTREIRRRMKGASQFVTFEL
jgi:hypothetical protein